MRPIFAILLPLILLGPCLVQAQNWANRLGTTNYATTVDKILPLGSQQMLVIGTFAAPTLALGNTTISSKGQEDAYISIANLDGTYSWALPIGGTGKDLGIDGASNPQGNFSVVGNFNSSSIKIGSLTLNNNGESDIFITHFDANRNLVWAKSIGSSDVEEASSVAVDKDGNTYVTGKVLDKLTLLLIRIFIRKFDSNGNLLWEKNGTNQGGYLSGTALTIDDQQNIYFAGSVTGTAKIDQTTITSDHDYSAFLIKYQSDGKELVTKTMDELEKFNALQIKNQRLYAIAQQYNWALGWGWPLADSKIHTLCFTNDLNIVWHKNAGGLHPSQSLDIAKAVSVDDNENVYVAGYFFSDTLHFAGQAHANRFHIHYYYPQIFVLKYNSTGEEKWINTYGDLLSDEATGIIAIKNDQLILAGNFESETLQLGQKTLNNTNDIDSMYVHLRPKRFFRKSMSYLAHFTNFTNSAPLLKEQPSITIWPNPTDQVLNIQFHQPCDLPIQLHFSSIDGKVLRSVVYNTSETTLQEDISHYPPGIYLLQVNTGNSTFTKTIVKQTK